MVERTEQGPMVRLVGGLAGVDPRRLRLHGIPADHAANLAGIRRAADRGRLCPYRDLVDAPGRRSRLRLVGRSGRSQASADDLDIGLLGVQLHRGIFAQPSVSIRLSRAARHLYGRGMARWCGIGDGKLAGTLPRLYEWRAPGLLGYRVCAL